MLTGLSVGAGWAGVPAGLSLDWLWALGKDDFSCDGRGGKRRGGSYDPGMRLLERTVALAALHECPPGRVVLVTGEAGIGKTSLVRRFRDESPRTVLWGECDAMRTPRPLGPVRDMARQSGARQSGSGLAAAIAADAPRHEIFAAFLDILSGGHAVVVEDAHWADEATLDLLGYAARRIGSTKGLLIVTYRDDEVGPEHPLRPLLGLLATDRTTVRLRLAPLSLDGVAELVLAAEVTNALSPAASPTLGVAPAIGAASAPVAAADRKPDAERLHALTGGNPFYLAEVLADPGQPVPASVRDVVLARAARLGPEQRAALDAAAIFPGGAGIGLIDADPAAIDGCVAAGMLVAASRLVRFRHELARLAVNGAIPPGRKAALHAAALASLRAAGADPARLAYHAEEAGDAAAVLRHASEAARRATAVGANRQVADQYARALRFAAGLPPAERAELLTVYAETCDVIGDAAALSASSAALECWREAGDQAQEAALLARRAHYLWSGGEAAAARSAVREAMTLAERLPAGPALAAAYTWSGYLLMLARDVTGAIDASEHAVDLIGRYGTPVLLSRALNALGAAYWFTDPRLAQQTLRRAVEAARAAGDDAGAGWALVNLGSGAGEIRAYAVAEPALREAIDWATARDHDRAAGYATAWLGRCQFERGEWAAATRTLAAASGPDKAVPARIVRLTTLGRLRARRGDPGAAEVLAEAWTLAEKTGDLQRLWPVAAGRAELAWLSGRPDAEVSDLVASTYELAVRLGHPWAIGELRQWLRAGEPAANPSATVRPNAAALAAAASAGPGAAAAALAEPEAADPYRLPPERAALAWERLGCPYEAASALALAGEQASGGHAAGGQAAPRQPDGGEAAAAPAGLLLEALRGFERLGARPAADRVAARLRALGVRTRRRRSASTTGPRRRRSGRPRRPTGCPSTRSPRSASSTRTSTTEPRQQRGRRPLTRMRGRNGCARTRSG